MTPRKPPASLEDLLELDEGRRRAAYRDSLGYLTIGVGRLIDDRKGGGLRESEIDLLLANDISEKTAEVVAALPWFSTLDQVRKAVVLSMAFQLGTGVAPRPGRPGTGLLAFQNTLAAIASKRWTDAAAGMRASAWARQTPDRVDRLADMMALGVWK